jgi:hypothetical protein
MLAVPTAVEVVAVEVLAEAGVQAGLPSASRSKAGRKYRNTWR